MMVNIILHTESGKLIEANLTYICNELIKT